MSNFVHLRVHSEFSLVDSTIRIDAPKQKGTEGRRPALPLAQAAVQAGLSAVALTDKDNVFGSAKFFKSAEAAGLKPILGADVTIAEDLPGSANRATLIALSPDGQKSLARILSRSYREGQSAAKGPSAKPAWIFEDSGDLIALLGIDSRLGRLLAAGNIDEAAVEAQNWKNSFGDRFYIAIQRIGESGEEVHIASSLKLSVKLGIPLVATNDVRFLNPDDFDAHDARVCIAHNWRLTDPNRPRLYSREQYLKSPRQMAELFKDIPAAIENTVEIAQRANPSIVFGAVHLPQFPVPGGRPVAEYIADLAKKGLDRRLMQHPPHGDIADYHRRLGYELAMIEKMGFSGYFLIVSDFISWSKSNGVPVGPGRGSGAGSLVAYALDITDLDPIQYGLLFERFLNPDRVSLPDFDVDFCMDGRERVIAYVTEKYGRDRVGQIITYSTMAGRQVLRDASRVLDLPLGLADRVAKMIPGIPAFKGEAHSKDMSELEYALDQIPELRQEYQRNDEVKSAIDLGLQLESLTRGVGKHPGGVIIAPRPLTDFVAMYCEADGGGGVTQYDMKDIEGIGLIKFDFLGLRTVTIINNAVQAINRRNPGLNLEILAIPRDDHKTFETYGTGALAAIFQMESAGMCKLSADFKPNSIEDLTAIVSLYRPGPMDLIPEYIARKRGEKAIEPLHPEFEACLTPTYGIMVYQEQVMQIAQRVAGYTLGAADLLRRAMGKKKPEEMAKQRTIFIEGCGARGIDIQTATRIFNLMEEFAKYGFNKSHAAAYALLSYQTAWLKTHYPGEFMASVISSEMNDTDTVVAMVQECRRLGLTVESPSIQTSTYVFEATGQGTIRYGLGAVRGVGQSAAEAIVAARSSGPFSSLSDFCRRVGTTATNKRTIEALIKAGAMDCLGSNRATLMLSVQSAVQDAGQSAAARAHGQCDLFGGESAHAPLPELRIQPDWDDLTRLTHEREALGTYVTGHPFQVYRGVATKLSDGSLAKQIADYEAAQVPGSDRPRRMPDRVVAGWVLDVKRIKDRGLILIEDQTARVNCLIGEEDWPSVSRLIKPDMLMFVSGRLAPDKFTGGYQVLATQVFTFDSMLQRNVERITIDVRSNPVGLKEIERVLLGMTSNSSGTGAPVFISRSVDGPKGGEPLGEKWNILVTEANLRRLKVELGAEVFPRIPPRPAPSRALLDYQASQRANDSYEQCRPG